MFMRFILLAVTAPAAAIATFEEGETGAAAGHAAAGTADYTPEDSEDD
jgi:hypothetical protein